MALAIHSDADLALAVLVWFLMLCGAGGALYRVARSSQGSPARKAAAGQPLHLSQKEMS